MKRERDLVKVFIAPPALIIRKLTLYFN